MVEKDPNNIELSVDDRNIVGAEIPATKEEYEKQLDDLFTELNFEAAGVIQQTEAGKMQINNQPEATLENKAKEEESRNLASNEVSAVVSEYGNKVAEITITESTPAMPSTASFSEIVETPLPDAPHVSPEFAVDDISRTPVEDVGVATGVGLNTSDVQPVVVVEKTPLTEADWLKQADEILETSDEALERSKSVFGKPKSEAEDQLKSAFARVSPMAMNGIIHRTEAISKENPKEATVNPVPEVKKSEGSFLNTVGNAIGKGLRGEYAVNMVPTSAVETLEDRRTREAYEQHADSYNVARERTIYPKFLQEIMDTHAVNNFEKSLRKNSNELAFLKGNIEKKGVRMAMIDDSLRENSEKIKLLSNDPILNQEERLTKQKEFEAKNKKLVAEQSDLKASIEGATQQYDWVKSQMDVAEKSRDIIVKSVTSENEAKLKPLKDQEEIDAREISNLNERIKTEREYIASLEADKTKTDITQKTKDNIDREIRAIRGVIMGIVDKKNKFERSAVDVRAKIHKLEANSKKFGDFSENKHSDKHESLDKEKNTKTGVSEPNSSVETNSSGGGSDDYEPQSFTMGGNVELEEDKPAPAPKPKPTPTPAAPKNPEPIAREAPTPVVNKPTEVAPSAPAAAAKPEAQRNPENNVATSLTASNEGVTATQNSKLEKTTKNHTRAQIRQGHFNDVERLGFDAKLAVRHFERVKTKAVRAGFALIEKNLQKKTFKKYKELSGKSITTSRDAFQLSDLNRILSDKIKAFVKEKKAKEEKEQLNAMARQQQVFDRAQEKNKRQEKMEADKAHNQSSL